MSSSTRFGHRIIIILWAFTMLQVICGCSLIPNIQPEQASVPTVTNPAYRPAMEVQACLDTKPLYPEQFFRAAASALAGRVDEDVTVNSGGMTIFVNLITHDSLPENIMSFTVPSLPPYPLQPTLKTDSGAYKNAQDRQTYHKELVSWQAKVTTLQHTLSQVQAQAKQNTDKLRTLLDFDSDPVAQDTFGCLFDASQHFAHFQGVKYLYIASGLQNNTAVDVVQRLSLAGVHVTVVWFRCTTASSCQQTQETWTQTFRRFGASSVTFFYPGAPASEQVSF